MDKPATIKGFKPGVVYSRAQTLKHYTFTRRYCMSQLSIHQVNVQCVGHKKLPHMKQVTV